MIIAQTQSLRCSVFKAAQHRLHLTAFGAVCGGHLVEKAVSGNLVLFKSAAGEPNRSVATNHMKYLITILLLLASSGYSQDLAYVQAYGSKVYFAAPDTSQWVPFENSMDSRTQKYVLMFKSKPITDDLGRLIQPVISILIESVKDSSDIINYSIWKRTQVPFEVKKVMVCDTVNFSWFACPNAIGYEGVYSKSDVVHRIFVVHMRRSAVGVQIICDSTDGVYAKVEIAMREFIRSVGIDQ